MSGNVDFSQLPADVLFIVLDHLDALSILRLRQTCRTLSYLTKEQSVWNYAYEHADCFLPPANVAALSVSELECQLVRATRLEWNLWTQQPVEPTTRRSLHLQDETIKPYETYMYLYLGRYLLVAAVNSLSLYNLDLERPNLEAWEYQDPICGIPIPKHKKGFFHFSQVNGDCYVGMLPSLRSHTPAISLWRLEFDSHPALRELESVPVDTNATAKIELVGPYIVCAYRTPDPHYWICHIPTRREYTAPASHSSLDWTWHAISLHHFLIIENKSIRVFDMPDPYSSTDATGGPSELHLTHSAQYSLFVTEPTIFHSSATHIKLAYISNATPNRPNFTFVVLTLRPDEAMDVSEPWSPWHSPPMAEFHLVAATDHTGERHRFVTLQGQKRMMLCQMNGYHWFHRELPIPPLDEHDFGDWMYAFDGARGRMCVLRSDLSVLVQDYA